MFFPLPTERSNRRFPHNDLGNRPSVVVKSPCQGEIEDVAPFGSSVRSQISDPVELAQRVRERAIPATLRPFGAEDRTDMVPFEG